MAVRVDFAGKMPTATGLLELKRIAGKQLISTLKSWTNLHRPGFIFVLPHLTGPLAGDAIEQYPSLVPCLFHNCLSPSGPYISSSFFERGAHCFFCFSDRRWGSQTLLRVFIILCYMKIFGWWSWCFQWFHSKDHILDLVCILKYVDPSHLLAKPSGCFACV